MTDVSIIHLSDLHFGGHADLAQTEALEALVPALGADAIVVSGDLTQRARHGEFQRALVFVQRLREHAPTLVIPGNHDIEWWKSPLGLRGNGVKYAKYVQYFGELRPVLEIRGEGGEVLIPLAEEFVRVVDLEGGRMVVARKETVEVGRA